MGGDRLPPMRGGPRGGPGRLNGIGGEFVSADSGAGTITVRARDGVEKTIYTNGETRIAPAARDRPAGLQHDERLTHRFDTPRELLEQGAACAAGAHHSDTQSSDKFIECRSKSQALTRPGFTRNAAQEYA